MKLQQGTVRVLLVEDSAAVAERVCESIREIGGVTVVETLNHEETATERLARGGIDVVILDLHLSRGSGFGVLRALSTRKHRRPVVVIFTNYDLPEYRRQAIALGADHYLDKGRDFGRIPDLLRSIRDACRATASEPLQELPDPGGQS